MGTYPKKVIKSLLKITVIKYLFYLLIKVSLKIEN